MTVRTTISGQSIEHTLYWQGDRKRMEYRISVGYRLGPHLALITRCDLGQMFDLNLDSFQYESAPYPPKVLTNDEMRARGLDRQKVAQPEKPSMRIEIKTLDTGERKQLFGRTARHVITTTKQTSFEGSQSQPEETIRDGWYVDLNQTISCDPEYMQAGRGYAYAYVVLSSLTGSRSETMAQPEFVRIGKPEMGFALQEVITSDPASKSADGLMKHTKSEFKTVVTGLQEGPLDPALFEVPHGFKRVKEIERNPPMTSNPVMEIWYWAQYKIASWFTFD